MAAEIVYDSTKHKAEVVTSSKVASKPEQVKKPEKQKNPKAKNTKVKNNKKLQQAVLKLLRERNKWLVSKDIVQDVEEVKNRGMARRVLRELEAQKKVKILPNPNRARSYIFGLPDFPEPKKEEKPKQKQE